MVVISVRRSTDETKCVTVNGGNGLRLLRPVWCVWGAHPADPNRRPWATFNGLVEGAVYALMKAQRRARLVPNPEGAPLDLVRRAYQRTGRSASYGAPERLLIGVEEGDGELRIAYIPDELDIPFDVFEFPWREMSELFENGHQAAEGYEFLDRRWIS